MYIDLVFDYLLGPISRQIQSSAIRKRARSLLEISYVSTSEKSVKYCLVLTLPLLYKLELSLNVT